MSFLGHIPAGRSRRLKVNSVEEDVSSILDVDEDSELLGEGLMAILLIDQTRLYVYERAATFMSPCFQRCSFVMEIGPTGATLGQPAVQAK